MLVGRAAELHRIDVLLDEARRGRAGAVVVRGEPGIGKTMLLDHAAQHAGGFRLLRATGVESEAELACSGLHQLLLPVLDRLDELPVPQKAALRAALALDTSVETDRFAVYLGTLGLLAASAEAGPLLCLIEDAHWLDAVSAEALAFAARRLHAEPVAMVFAARTGERPFVAAGVPDIQLAPLDEETSQTLLATSGRRLSQSGEQMLLRIAGGNPLALLELPRSLSDQDLIGAAADEPVPVTRAIEDAYLGRVHQLSADARRALVLAAAAGPSGLGVLLDDEALVRALEEAELADLVHVGGGAVVFRHPLVRAAAYHAATGAERRHAHAKLAAALSRGAADERSWHLAAAAVGPDDEVAELLVAVADRAGQRGSMAARARALGRSAELTRDGHVRCRRLLDAATAAFAAGQAALARSLVDQASELADDEVLQADAAFARWDIQAEDWATLFPSYMRAADAVAATDRRRSARMLSYAVDYLFAAGRTEESSALVERAWALLDRQLVPGLLGVAVDVAWVRLAEGQLERAVDLAAEVLEIAARSDDREDFDDLGFAADVLTYAEDSRARHTIEELVARMRTRATLPGLCSALAALAQLDLRQGRLRAAYAAAGECFTIGELLGGWRAFGSATLLACIEGALGHREACSDHADLVVSLASSDNHLGLAITRGALGLAALASGDLTSARRDLHEAIELSPPGQLDWPGTAARTNLAEVLLRLGEVDEACTLLEAFERDQAHAPSALAAARRCRLLAAQDGELDELAAQALAAIAGRWPFEEARTRLVFGERLRRGGRRVDARQQLQRALALFDSLGADAWAEHARRELRASGASLRRGREAADALTPQEVRIAIAVAEGKSNREVGAALFISPKTVEMHLSRIYRKLGIRSRLQLARMHTLEPSRFTNL